MSSQLEARAHGDRDALPPPWDIDPLATPALRRALPGIDAGFDAAEMTARLQSALFGTSGDAPVVESCEPGKAMYLGDEGCRIRYDLTVREPSSGRTRRRLVLGRLLATEDQAAAHFESLQPLAASAGGRDEVAGLVRPTALLADLAMVVHAFPIDGDLPALVPATDPAVMGPVLAEALGEDGASDGWRVETGHYGRRHRCVLRYERDAGPGSQPTVVYGKLCWDRSGAQLVDGFADLQAAMAGIGVRLPSLLGYRPELGLSLLAELPGTPLLDGLRRRRTLGPAAAAAGARLAGEVAAAGRVAAALHRFPARWGRARPFTAEVAGLQDELTAMAAISPQLAARLEAHLAAVSAAVDLHPSSTVQAHGDFTFSQLLDDGGRIGLLDFDSLCHAEPGLDLGQFLAYLRLTAAKAGTDGVSLARGLEPRFRSAYADAGGGPMDRVEAYTALSLLRITVHAWQKLKPARARLALSTLEESELCH